MRQQKSILIAFTVLAMMTGCKTKVTTVPPINLKDLDQTVKPGDDFYQYANGGWIKSHPLKPEYSRYGSFDVLDENNQTMIKDLVIQTAKNNNPTGSNAQKIGDFYYAGMDSAGIEAAGIKPLEKELGNIAAINSVDDVQKAIIHLQGLGLDPLFSFYGEQDSKNSAMVISQLAQGGLGMADRDYYLSDDPRSKEIRKEYVKYISKIFQLIGEQTSDADRHSQIIMDLETKLATASMPRVDMRDPYKIYHKMSLADLQSLSPNFNWQLFFSGIGLANPGDINVLQPDFYKTVSDLMNTTPVENWKLYLRWNLVNSMAPYLSNNFVNTRFAFYGKVMRGTEVILPRWKRVLSATDGSMGEVLGKLYVEKYFPPEAKAKVLDLVNNLKWSLGERIKNLTWMSDETKAKALDKLSTINVKIGYPDVWRDFSGLSIDRSSYFNNILISSRFNFNYMVSKINKPVDRNQWDMTPQTVNAYYNPTMNEICFPAGILQPPFFNVHADDPVNYGAIGVVIGHEISHGFDDEGRQYDKTGNLNDWWTKEDAQKFSEKAQVLVNEFNSFTVLDTIHANGNLTLGENLADFGGLNISYFAMQKALKEKPVTKKIDGFTPEQRFYLAFAHVWGQNIRDKEILRRTKEDVHSLGRYRVNGPLPNLPEFLKAFNIQPGDKMYLPTDKRAIIW